MGPIPPTSSDVRVLMLTAFSRANRRAICQCNRRLSLNSFSNSAKALGLSVRSSILQLADEVIEYAEQAEQCPLMAQSGHATPLNQCLLLGVKRTCCGSAGMSAYNPKRTQPSTQRLFHAFQSIIPLFAFADDGLLFCDTAHSDTRRSQKSTLDTRVRNRM